jgi:aerobic-type carbon monoxide dehydrogenase small subunit (CoxS/CutS family)
VPARQQAELEVNGRRVRLDIHPGETLLSTLRNRLRLTGAKEACNRGECGACTVLVGDVPTCSCVVLTLLVDDPVTTVEGLDGEVTQLRRFLAEEGGLQCGFCTPGQVVRAASLLRGAAPRGEEGIRDALSGNLCRCTGYDGIVRAVRRALHARAAR